MLDSEDMINSEAIQNLIMQFCLRFYRFVTEFAHLQIFMDDMLYVFLISLECQHLSQLHYTVFVTAYFGRRLCSPSAVFIW